VEDGNATPGRIVSGVPGGSEDGVAHIVHRDKVGNLPALTPHHVQHAHTARQAHACVHAYASFQLSQTRPHTRMGS
jgi:hypothetical protein